ncbi:AAA family ATPase [Nocardiopsis rhodophaea]
MADSIAFAFGQKVSWKLAFSRYVSHVELRAQLQDEEVWLRRYLGSKSKYVDILNLGFELVERLPVASTRRVSLGETTISDRLLSLLDLKEKIDPDEIRAVNNRASRLGFTDVWNYIYRTQSEIDRQVILHQDSNSSRKQAFELLFDLADPRAQILQARLKECKKSLQEQARSQKTLMNFFDQSTVKPDQAVVEYESTLAEKGRLQKRLKEVREQARLALRRSEALHQAADQAHKALRNAMERRRCADRSVDIAYEALRSHKQSLLRQGNAFDKCPACSSRLDLRPVPEAHCNVCLQPKPEEPANDPNHNHREYERASAALATAEREASAAHDKYRDAATAAMEADEGIRDYQSREIAPFRDSIEELLTLHAAATERLTALSTQKEHYERLQEIESGIRATQKEIDALKGDIQRIRDQLSSRRRILAELDKRFHEGITALELPWFTGQAQLDHADYLPLIDQQAFSQLGGGIKAAVNVAYSFALMRHAMINHHVAYLPSLLIVDSINKNIGSNSTDRALANRIYKYALSTEDARADTAFTSPIQLIILDNDRPSKKNQKLVHEFHLSHEDPLVPGVTHEDTGEDPTHVE